ncbi:MAG: GNAT family N-acetyltransferase, partial [Clostridioides difficile]|nr:GNAT family N-acetyltransferase [Clostridioides difficile]
MEYKVNDQELNASMFIPFVNRIWPGDYDTDKTQTALSKTLNITAYDDKVLVGCLRVLS